VDRTGLCIPLPATIVLFANHGMFFLASLLPSTSALGNLTNLADSLLLLALFISQLDYLYPLIKLFHLVRIAGVPDQFAIIALLLGCNPLDFLCVSALLLLQCWHGLEDMTNSAVCLIRRNIGAKLTRIRHACIR